jgi:hypothetical protein
MMLPVGFDPRNNVAVSATMPPTGPDPVADDDSSGVALAAVTTTDSLESMHGETSLTLLTSPP